MDAKWESFGWHVLRVDGHDTDALYDAYGAAKAVLINRRSSWPRPSRARAFLIWKTRPNGTVLRPMKPVRSGHERIGGAVMNRVPMRDGYGKALLELCRLHDDVMVLDADVAKSTRTEWIRKEFPDKYINVGISEQDLVGTAAACL